MSSNDRNKYSVAGVTRPLCITDFVSGAADRPTVRPIALAELEGLEPPSLFESPAWLKAYGIENLVAISADRQGGAEYPLLFAVRDRHLLHLGSLLWFEAACIEYLTDVLLEQPGVDFVVFEDVQVEGPLSRRFGGSAFRYRRNWQIVLNGSEAEQYKNSSKSRSTNRRKQRAMERDLGGVRIELERKPSRDLVKAIVELNRAKIETANRTHAIDARELDRLWAAVSQIGHVVTIRHGSRLIAGDIICTVGSRAYYVVTGYDMNVSQYSPGVIAHHHSIEDSRQRGVFDFNMLWGDGVYKRRLGGKPRDLSTLVKRRSPSVRFTPAYVRAVGAYHWLDFKARVKPLVRRQTAR